MEQYQPHIEKAIEELLNPTFEVTKQYLEVCELEYLNGKSKIARVSDKYYPKTIAIYFCIQNHSYFIEVHVSKGPDIKVDFVYTESAHRVYFTATSSELSFENLKEGIKLSPLKGWSKGEMSKNGKSAHRFSILTYEPIKNEAFGLE